MARYIKPNSELLSGGCQFKPTVIRYTLISEKSFYYLRPKGICKVAEVLFFFNKIAAKVQCPILEKYFLLELLTY